VLLVSTEVVYRGSKCCQLPKLLLRLEVSGSLYVPHRYHPSAKISERVTEPELFIHLNLKLDDFFYHYFMFLWQKFLSVSIFPHWIECRTQVLYWGFVSKGTSLNLFDLDFCLSFTKFARKACFRGVYFIGGKEYVQKNTAIPPCFPNSKDTIVNWHRNNWLVESTKNNHKI